MGADVAAEREDAREVHLEHGVPVAVWELVRGVPLLDSAAVEQDVDSVAVCYDLRCESCYRLVRGEVGGVDCCFAAELFNGLFCLLVRLVALRRLLVFGTVGLRGLNVPEQEECLLLLLQERGPWTDQFLVCLLLRGLFGPRVSIVAVRWTLCL